MNGRRGFLKNLTAFLASSFILGSKSLGNQNGTRRKILSDIKSKPLVISTWKHGLQANIKAWNTLERRGKAIDAVQSGVMEIESDPTNKSVGIGGMPDRDGIVSLDACVMDEKNRCGSVAFLKSIVNAVAVARQVMEKTPHVMLVGEGAFKFALEEGFKETDLLTPEVKKLWKEWLKTSHYEPIINIENHDTIGMLALDMAGDLSGACTTSGLAYKMHGRVGDSPIIGAGLFVDNEVGAATATGVGEAVIRTAGTHTIVELMRQGLAPTDACKVAIERIVNKIENAQNIQVGYLALNANGDYGAYSIHKGFNYAVKSNETESLFDADYYFKK